MLGPLIPTEAAGLISSLLVWTAAVAGTSAPSYLEARADGVQVCPILSVGDTVSSSNSAGFARMVGIPDGMGVALR